MRTRTTMCLLVSLGLAGALPAHAQAPRLDVIWARQTTDPITLDGVLNEPAWAAAESVHVTYMADNGIPGSGWKNEVLGTVTDPMTATLRFLVVGNKLYLGAHVKDKYVGGGPDFNYFDGFLMGLKDHSSLGHPAPPAEYTYTWWNYGDADPSAPGKPPTFVGRWGLFPAGTAMRPPESVAAWNAVTLVDGLSNSDAVLDDGYWVEMVFDLTVMGYHANVGGGDIIEWNISIYDADKWWPPTLGVTGNRTWWQSPWANAMWYNEVRIYTRPNVTTTSGPVPPVGPEYYVQNGATFPAPAVDGVLNETVWSKVPGFDIRYGDDALRSSYAAVGPYRSGQYQPTVNERVASVLDQGDATVKMFFRGDRLYLGFDVRDQVVQNAFNLFDRWDGFLVTINDRTLLNPSDHVLQPHRFTFHVGHNGVPVAEDELPAMVASGDAQLGLALKPGTTAEDTASSDIDTGYTAELSFDLTKLGYPPGRGDGTLYIGIDMLDGDSFDPFTLSYGTRTWWYREREGECCPTWAYMDPTLNVVGIDDGTRAPDRLALLGNAPNPFRFATTIRYTLPAASDVTLEVYDLQGRLVARHAQGLRSAGEQHAMWVREGVKSGIYMYRLVAADPTNSANRQTLSGKMLALE